MKPVLPLFVKKSFDLAQEADIAVVGKLKPAFVNFNSRDGMSFRPRRSFRMRELKFGEPTALPALFSIAVNDLLDHGIDPGRCFVYLLYHSALVPPAQALREPHWHFDLRRFLRAADHDGIPLAYGYSVSSALPTQFLTRVFQENGQALPAYDTICDEANHQRLGDASLKAGYGFKPEAGEVVRYTNLVMHRGEKNETDQSIFRTFMHVAFSPIDPDWLEIEPRAYYPQAQLSFGS